MIHLFTKMFFFQLAEGGIEREIYKKLIAPFKNDLPASQLEGFSRVCADHKYAFFGVNLMKMNYYSSITCRVIPIPGFSYSEPWAFIISNNSSYKGLINWR